MTECTIVMATIAELREPTPQAAGFIFAFSVRAVRAKVSAGGGFSSRCLRIEAA
jgi:hypothetical protein